MKIRINEFVYIELCGGVILVGRYKDNLCIKWSKDPYFTEWLLAELIRRETKGIMELPIDTQIFDEKHTKQIKKLAYDIMCY